MFCLIFLLTQLQIDARKASMGLSDHKFHVIRGTSSWIFLKKGMKSSHTLRVLFELF